MTKQQNYINPWATFSTYISMTRNTIAASSVSLGIIVLYKSLKLSNIQILVVKGMAFTILFFSIASSIYANYFLQNYMDYIEDNNLTFDDYNKFHKPYWIAWIYITYIYIIAIVIIILALYKYDL